MSDAWAGYVGVNYDTLLERVAALKHDLGKYVAWRSANLDDAAWTSADDELVEALRADILETRRRDDQVETAWEVWWRLTEDLPRPLESAELRRVEGAVAVLREHEAALREGERARLREVTLDLRDAQREIRESLRDLQRRLRRGEA